MRPTYSLFCLFFYTISFVTCHSVDNKQLLWVEPIKTVKLDIAARSTLFFEKRDISPNSHYQPNARSLQFDDSLRLSVDAYNKTMYLHLSPNYDLFHPQAVVHQEGKSVRINPSDYRVYRGYVVDPIYSDHYWISGFDDNNMEDQPGILGWARITVRNDIKHHLDHPLFEGAFTLYGDTYHVKLRENYYLTKRDDDAELTEQHLNAYMIIYRDSDTVLQDSPLANTAGGCGFDRLTHTSEKIYNPLEINMDYTAGFGMENKLFGKTLVKRAPPTGCPTTKKILYMGAAADCTYVKYYQNADKARMQIINDWNSVSNVYGSTFNVNIGLINITIMDSTCPSTPVSSVNWNQACSTGYSISSRLSDFSRWRGNIGDDGAGLWHLMTNCATGPEVGIAWMSQVCNTGTTRSSSSGEYTSGTGVSSIIRDEWKVVAHEIGHGFGAIHDCTSQNCPCSGTSCQCCPYSSTQCDAGGRYFMNPTSNASSDAFSPCSITTICTAMPNYLSCLEEPGSRNVTTLQMCGNGIKETGEDCDTGGQASNCCDSATCKFKSGAVCDDFNDLCCNNCQLRPANYTCRPASGECDVAEVCSGTSGDCPSDKYKDDLTSCSNGMKCASGQCTSRDAQCVARGTTSNIKKSCGADNGCAMSCQNPSSALSCIIFPGNFMDGTPCGIGGVCKSGSCDESNFGNNALNWINSHLYIVIPVAVVVGLLLLFCLFRCCCYSYPDGYNNLGKTTIYTIPGQQQPYPQYSAGPQPYYPPPPPPPQQPYYAPPPNGWVDPALYNGPPGSREYPQQPVPAYSQTTPHHDAYELNNANNWQNNHTPSTPLPGSPAPNYNQVSSPSPTPAPPQHGSIPMGNRPYNEGVI
ncbi:Metallo-peptidase family M12-domain-containing protein [Gilbertella persicaria]|uniref:Metallo-peptidase family M12-domain-containing protein n=1 Tax=Gilbertella persicaria TaxID=101096 RepID=UPI002220BBE4|nr:Metallo-peptidase family M12-domain-containing protein [Gilbertella persicaria]KAI8079512.1 Metallo-peptidase family M12-domain-containing protein [Gilbertella persicaria]